MFRLPILAYRVAPPAEVGMQDAIYPLGDRPQVSLFGIGGRPTDGQLTPIPGGGLVAWQNIMYGAPRIVPTPGSGQWLEQR